MRKSVIITLLVLCLPLISKAQGGRYDNIVLAGSGRPVGGAKISVCSQPATIANGSCTPTVTVYTDTTDGTACTGTLQFPPLIPSGPASGCSNPLLSNGFGNFHFYAPVGTPYTLVISGVGITTTTLYDQVTGTTGGGAITSVFGRTGIVVQQSGDYACTQVTNCPATNADTTWTNNLRIKGPSPHADLSAFTRPINTNGCSTTATINILTPTIATLANGACFQTNNGLFNDGITIWGAGASVSISSPGAPTVTPNTISSGGVNLGGGNYTPNTVVNGATGSSTYSYIIVAFDQFGGFAAPSSATTITNGPATLGPFSCTISTETRSGTNVTKNYSSSCPGAVAGAMSFDTGTQPNPAGTFAGFFNTQTVNSSTQVVYAGPYNSASFGWNSTDNGNSGTNSSSGGTSYFFNSNHLSWTYGAGVWRYGICVERPGDGSYHRVGMTRPSTSVNKDIQFDDYGATMMAGYIFPPYFTDAVCNGVAGQNDPLTTTITAGAGTTTVTLANAASNGVTSATALFDNGPGLVAAGTSVATNPAGELYVPPTAFTFGYVINSFTTLPATKIRQAGKIAINETIKVPGGVTWSGDAAVSCSPTAFQYFTGSAACILMQNANPAIYIAGDLVWMQNLSFITTGSDNWGTMIVDDAPHTRFSNMGFSPDGATDSDFLSIPLVLRGGNGSADCQYDLDHIGFGMAGFSTTPGSWNPGIFIPSAQASDGTLTNGGCIVNLSKMSIGLHGIIQEGSGVDWNMDNIDRQGGVMPFLWHLNGSPTSGENISANTVSLDTDGTSLLSIGNNNGMRVVDNFKGYDVKAGTGTTFGGFGPSSLSIDYSITTTLPNANGGTSRQCARTGVGNLITLNCNFDYNAYIGPTAKIYTPLAAPTGVTGTAVAGGTITASIQIQFIVVANDINGQSSIGSTASAGATTSNTCPGSGNCQFSVSWTPVPGASSYSVFGCQVGAAGVMFQCPTYTNILGAGTNATASPVTLNVLGGGSVGPQSVTLAGLTGLTSIGLWGPQTALSEGSAPTAAPNMDQMYADSTAHRILENSNGGSVWLAHSLVVCSGTYALSTGNINNNSRTVNTFNTCPQYGTAANINHLTDHVSCSFVGDINGQTGYAVSAPFISIRTYIPTADGAFDVDQINQTGAAIPALGAVSVACAVTRP